MLGALVGMVYLVASLGQLASGLLARKVALKRLYLGAILLEMIALLLGGLGFGLPILPLATLMAVASAAQLPVETLLVAQNTPPRHIGSIFGLRYVLGFCAAPAAVELVAALASITGSVVPVFLGVAAIAGLGALAVAFLATSAPLTASPPSARTPR
jgi:MFS family permease